MADIPSGRRRHLQHHTSHASPTPLLSSSLKDVLYVAPDELCTDKELRLKSRKGSASNLMSHEPGAVQHKARQDHENEPAEVVIVCEPEGTSLMMGGLHPRYDTLRSDTATSASQSGDLDPTYASGRP